MTFLILALILVPMIGAIFLRKQIPSGVILQWPWGLLQPFS